MKYQKQGADNFEFLRNMIKFTTKYCKKKLQNTTKYCAKLSAALPKILMLRRKIKKNRIKGGNKQRLKKSLSSIQGLGMIPRIIVPSGPFPRFSLLRGLFPRKHISPKTRFPSNVSPSYVSPQYHFPESHFPESRYPKSHFPELHFFPRN
jgi:hypothetical protein